MIILPDPSLHFSINIPVLDPQVPKIPWALVSDWETLLRFGESLLPTPWSNSWLPTSQRSHYTRPHLISFFTGMTPNLCDKNEPRDTTPRNVFLLDPPKDKMFSAPPLKDKHSSPNAPFNWLVDCPLGVTAWIYPGCVTKLEKPCWFASTLTRRTASV